MRMPEFQAQVQRLKNTFGDRVYTSEREKVLWKEVGGQDIRWLERACDYFIASRLPNHPPVPADFAQVMRDEREAEYQKEKAQRSRDAENVWSDAPPGFFDRFFNRRQE